MPSKKKKHATEMTNDEIAKRVFPPEVHRHLKKLVEESDAQKKSPRKKSKGE